MKDRNNNKKRYNNNAKKKREVQEEKKFVVTPEIAEDIENTLSNAVNDIKAKYPGSEEAMDTFLSALAQAMTDIINHPTEEITTIEDNQSSCEPVLPDYDKATDKMRETVHNRDNKEDKKEKKKNKDIDITDIKSFLEDDDNDEDDDIVSNRYGKPTKSGSTCKSWYNVHFTLDASDKSSCMKVKAEDEEEAENKVIMQIDESCTIDYVEEVENDDDDDVFDVPVNYNNDDDDDEEDEDSFYLAKFAFHRKPKRIF